MSVEFLTPTPATDNNWDRPPSPGCIRRIEAAKRRRASALTALDTALGRRPRGCTLGPIERAERIARLLQMYREASTTIIAEELL
jgi:hypothetical protein